MPLPIPAVTKPVEIDLEAGQRYGFCTCGLSAELPFCDGAHKGTDFRSLKFSALKTEKAVMRLCETGGLIFCDN